MTEKKKTIVEMYEEILALVETEEHKDFIKGRIAQHTKKATDRKPTEAQKLAMSKYEALADFFKANPSTMFTVSELIKKVSCFNTMENCSTSYATSIVTKLRNAGVIKRSEEKGRAYYQYVGE